MPLEVAQTQSFLIAPCEASLGRVVSLHATFGIYLVKGSAQETAVFETRPRIDAAGISPVLDSAAMPLRGATQRYKLVIQADGSRSLAPVDEPLAPRDIC